MRRVNVDNIASGAMLAKAIFSADSKILLESGVELKPNYIERLKRCNITEVYIEDDFSSGIVVSDVVSDEIRYQAVELVQKIMTDNTFINSTNFDEVKAIVNTIMDELLRNDHVLACLSDIRSVDDYTFTHSVNVCIIALVIAANMGFNSTRMKELGVGAIFHDIGKLKVPESILKKPSQLSLDEFEEIKKHTEYGYELLKGNDKISVLSAYIALGHHERFNGSGYPLGLKGDGIHKCARIVAVADVFDALTSDRVYRRKIKANEVFEYITSIGLHQFDQEIVQSFVKNIAIYPPGTGVLLNSGEKCLVVRVNKNMPTRPVVRVIWDNAGNKLHNYPEIDLLLKRNLFILDACDI